MPILLDSLTTVYRTSSCLSFALLGQLAKMLTRKYSTGHTVSKQPSRQ